MKCAGVPRDGKSGRGGGVELCRNERGAGVGKGCSEGVCSESCWQVTQLRRPCVRL